MNWIELKDKIYYWDGSWRDIYVLQIVRHDWKKWVDYVNQNYSVDWFNGKTNTDNKKVDFTVIEEYWNGNLDLRSTAKVFIDRIQINAHFFDDIEFENDIDPREFNSIEDHKKLIKYMIGVSTLLNKDIILTPEDEHETVLIKVSRGEVFFSYDIDRSN